MRRERRILSAVITVSATAGAIIALQPNGSASPVAIPGLTCTIPSARSEQKLVCMGISVSDLDTPITPAVTTIGTTTASVTGDVGEQLTLATITGDTGPWSIHDPACTGSSATQCTYSGQPVSHSIELDCQPSDTSPHMINLVVTGSEVGAMGSDQAEVALICQGSSSGSALPDAGVPDAGDSGDIELGQPPAITVSEGNTGSSTAIVTAIGTDHLVALALTGDNGPFTFDDSRCLPTGTTACTFSAPIRPRLRERDRVLHADRLGLAHRRARRHRRQQRQRHQVDADLVHAAVRLQRADDLRAAARDRRARRLGRRGAGARVQQRRQRQRLADQQRVAHQR